MDSSASVAMLSMIKECARKRFATGRYLFTQAVPLYVSGHDRTQNQVSDAIEMVEGEGWHLEQVTSFTTSGGTQWVLLIFRR